jgi:hypothetical protein
MKRGVRSGEGIYYYLDGRVYKGNWADNQINGFGAEEGAHFYEGEWLHGLWHGKGYLRLKDGSIFEGHFFQGKPEGTNTFKN